MPEPNGSITVTIKNGVALIDDTVLSIEDALKQLDPDAILVGDADLLGLKAAEVTMPQHFIDLKAFWKPVESLHTLVPALSERNGPLRFMIRPDGYKGSGQSHDPGEPAFQQSMDL